MDGTFAGCADEVAAGAVAVVRDGDGDSGGDVVAGATVGDADGGGVGVAVVAAGAGDVAP
jgi:hypothetical protein